LARDNPENRKQWGDDFPFGYEDVAESVCSSHSHGDTNDDDDENYHDLPSCPHYKDTIDEEDVDGTPVHVLIASYRDRLCGRTLHNLFTRAKHPERLFVRVIDQVDPHSDLEDDVGCWDTYCQKYDPIHCHVHQHQVQTIRIDAAWAKGPTDARSKLSALVQWDYVHREINDEVLELHPVHETDFCMQIDSHMDFHTDYDVQLIDMFHRARNDYAVLSTYVAAMEQNNRDPDNVPHLCMVTFTGSIRNWGTKECKFLRVPKLTNAMWGAGLSFHRCHGELNVPVDPYLDNVFDGEEGSRGIRFFTHGYDVYTPDRVLVTHDYVGHQHNPIVHTWGGGKAKKKRRDLLQNSTAIFRWNDSIESQRHKVSTLGTPRVNQMLGIGIRDGQLTAGQLEELHLIRSSRYGLGTKRTLGQAVTYTGIDLSQKRMVTNRCGNLEWVPFVESPNYGVDESLSRPLTPLSREELVVADAAAAARKQHEHGVPPDPLMERTGIYYEVTAGLLLAMVILLLSVRNRFRKSKGQRHKN